MRLRIVEDLSLPHSVCLWMIGEADQGKREMEKFKRNAEEEGVTDRRRYQIPIDAALRF